MPQHRRSPATSLVLESMKASSTAPRSRPRADGSITDFNAILKKEATVDEINAAFAKAAKSGPLKASCATPMT